MTIQQTSPASLASQEDLKSFIGPNYEKYCMKFKKFSINPASFQASWNWSAFLAGWWWLLYRKMYIWAAVSFVTFCIPYLNFITWIGHGIAGNYLYYRHVQKEIAGLKTHQGENYAQFLPSFGGVHKWVPIVAVIIMTIPIIFIGACAAKISYILNF